MRGLSKVYLDLYDAGHSTYSIADTLGVKPNTVRAYLNRSGVIRRRQYQEIEHNVAEMLRKIGSLVTEQNGCCEYDLLVDGYMVDVKSAKRGMDGRFCFELIHKGGAVKNICDYYILVFKDGNYPTYKLINDGSLSVQKIWINDPNVGKYRMEFLFNLM